MAQYLVQCGGKVFANRPLIKSIYGVGDSGLSMLIAKGDISVHELLGRAVYAVPKVMLQEVAQRKGVRHQSIEEQLEAFTSEGCEDLPKLPVKCQDVFCLYGLNLVLLRDIEEESTRYRTVRQLPHIEFLGSKYVILDVRSKEEPRKVATLVDEQ